MLNNVTENLMDTQDRILLNILWASRSEWWRWRDMDTVR